MKYRSASLSCEYHIPRIETLNDAKRRNAKTGWQKNQACPLPINGAKRIVYCFLARRAENASRHEKPLKGIKRKEICLRVKRVVPRGMLAYENLCKSHSASLMLTNVIIISCGKYNLMQNSGCMARRPIPLLFLLPARDRYINAMHSRRY